MEWLIGSQCCASYRQHYSFLSHWRLSQTSPKLLIWEKTANFSGFFSDLEDFLAFTTGWNRTPGVILAEFVSFAYIFALHSNICYSSVSSLFFYGDKGHVLERNTSVCIITYCHLWPMEVSISSSTPASTLNALSHISYYLICSQSYHWLLMTCLSHIYYMHFSVFRLLQIGSCWSFYLLCILPLSVFSVPNRFLFEFPLT